MKRNFIINLFFMTIVLTSCHKSEKYENAYLFSFKDFKITKSLNAATIEFDEPIMLPWLFVKSDSLLIVYNLRTNNMLYVYNINTRKKVGEFISLGNGPNDLLAIQNMQLVSSDLYIVDSQKKTIYKYDVNDFHRLTDNLIPLQKITVNDFVSALAYTGNGYVATRYAETPVDSEIKRLVFYNSKGETEFTAGEYPYFGREMTILEKMGGFYSAIVVSPKFNRVYLFGKTTDLIEIYDFQGILIKKIHGPEQFFPQAGEVRRDGYIGVSLLESKFAFSCPIIIDNEIYVSYSGNHYDINKQSVSIQHIFVFDMDCNPLRNYELSKPITSFTVDPETKKIYATSAVPEYHMVIFEE